MFNFTIPFRIDEDSMIGNISSKDNISGCLGGLVIGSLGDFEFWDYQ